MKLKTKIVISVMSVIMMLALLMLVESGARVTDTVLERYTDGGCDKEGLILTLASSDGSGKNYIISGTGGEYSSACDTEIRSAATLAELISQIEADGVRIVFDNVTSDAGFTLTQSVILDGELSLTAGSIATEADNVKFDGCEITLGEGSINVKRGNAKMLSGSLSSAKRSVFVLDYSSSARLDIFDGEITAGARESAILCKTGYVSISGGSVIAPYGTAIEAEATVELSGTPEISGFEYGIKTNKPIVLSGACGAFEASVCVLYDSLFERGSVCAVFRSANASAVDNISLYDANGESAELTFFEYLPITDERSCIAVYLPYEVKYYSGAELFYTEKILKNEPLVPPSPPSRVGYEFSGWYSDAERKDAYDFGKSVSADTSLYASFKLSVPRFVINSKEFIYDGAERTLSFDELSHPLAEEGSFSFEWYKDSQIIPYSSGSIPLRCVADSGNYNCKLMFSYNGDFVAVTTPNITVNIGKCAVKEPDIFDLEYSGGALYPDVPSSELYTSVCSVKTDVGTYPVTLTLKDPDNYKWHSTQSASATVYYDILPADNAFLFLPSAQDCFSGGIPKINAAVKFGTPTLLYSSDGVNFTPDVPEAVGSYFLKITVAESSNYRYLESDVISFDVLAELPLGIKLDKAPDKTDYRAFDTLSLEGAEFSVTYNSGRIEKVAASALTVRYKSGDCFHVSDNCAVICYGSVSVPVTVSVSAAEYDISSISFDSAEVVYNGKRQTIAAIGEVVGKDGIPLKLKVTGGGVNAGVYTVTLGFESDSINYKIPEQISKTLTVTPLSVFVNFGEREFVYDGTKKAPVATATGAEGSPLTLDVTGAEINAGVYCAVASIDDQNYILCDNEVMFEIKRADIDLSGVLWSGSEFTYDGSMHSVTVSGLPATVTLAGYTDSSFTNAGEYSATASLIYDADNYNAPPALVHKWSIVPANYDFSGCIFLDSEYVYDGNTHYPRLVGDIPVGADGSSPSYAFFGGALHVSEGIVPVTVSFSTESENYNTPESLVAFVKILPKPITVEWGNVSFVYDGRPHIPDASSESCKIEVLGAVSDAGSYVATAVTKDSDYYISNGKAEFVIAKGQNFWVSSPVVGVQFEGRCPAPHAKAHYGEVIYSYYADAELKTPISTPTAVGTYYVVASVPESANYVYLSHEPIAVDIIAVVPTDLIVSFREGSLVAKRVLGMGDLFAYLLNNDGSKTYLSSSDIKITYENQASLTASDKKITFSYASFEKTVDITVEKARYDMSGVKWSVTDSVYTGEDVFSYLTGLPDGVSVGEYISNFGKTAGIYELRATLLYDEDNYHAPASPIGILTVRKAKLPLPKPEAVFYDGTVKNISLSPDAPYTASFAGATDAGVYEIRLIPKDNVNYEFEEGGTVSFGILPAPITLKVAVGGNGYTLLSGKIYGDDVLSEEYYTEDGFVYVRISNPNYELSVVPAESRESFVVMIIFFLIMLVILLILAAFIVYNRRDKIIAFFATKDVKSSHVCRSCIENASSTPGGTDSACGSEPQLELLLAVDEPHANSLISDSLARNLVADAEIVVETNGKRKCIVNVNTVSESFSAGDTVDINKMKERGIIPKDAKRVKVLAGGVIDKPLTVIADSFSLSAVKMIALTGGHAIRVRSFVRSRKK